MHGHLLHEATYSAYISTFHSIGTIHALNSPGR